MWQKPTFDPTDKVGPRVNPYYLDDLKHRASVAHVGNDQLYAFDDLYGAMRCPPAC
jgi:hypothetical protein